MFVLAVTNVSVLLVVLALAAVFCVAFIKPCGISGWFGKVIVGVIILGVSLSVVVYAKLASRRAAEQQAFAQTQRLQIIAQQQQFPRLPNQYVPMQETTGYTPQFGGQTLDQPLYTRGIVMIFFLVIPLVVFFAFRRRRDDAGAGDPHVISRGAVMLVALAFFCLWLFRARSYAPQAQMARIETPTNQYQGVIMQPPATPDVPIDELWDRLNAPRIQMSTSTTTDLATANDQGEAEESSEPDAESVETQSVVEGSDDQGATVEPVASGSEGQHAAPPFVSSVTKTVGRPRPDWLDEPPRFVGNVRRMVIQAGPYSRLNECYEELRNELRNAVQEQVVDLAHESTGDAYVYVPQLDQMGITNTFITHEILADQYVEDGEASFGLTKTAWGLLEFTESGNQRLLAAWKTYARRDRMVVTAMLAAAVLSVVGGVFALLKIDTWTRGYYSKRLFLGVPAVIIAFLAIVLGFVG